MIRILLVIIFFLALWVPIFNRVEPTLFGFPFFYWYQILIIFVGSGLTWVVYVFEKNRKASGK